MTAWHVVLPLILAAAVSTASPPQARNAGERAYQKCYSCHALEPGKNDLDGPSLHGIIGRRIAAEQGFPYSPALRAFGRKHPRWTPDLVDRMAADPERLVPGTSMNFHGMPDPKERAALIAFLRSAGAAK